MCVCFFEHVLVPITACQLVLVVSHTNNLVVQQKRLRLQKIKPGVQFLHVKEKLYQLCVPSFKAITIPLVEMKQ